MLIVHAFLKKLDEVKAICVIKKLEILRMNPEENKRSRMWEFIFILLFMRES